MKFKFLMCCTLIAFITGCVSTDKLVTKQQTQGYNTVAFVQLPANESGDYFAMQNYAQTAKNNGAELVIFPESSAFGWLNPDVFSNANPIPGDSQQNFSNIAMSVGIWVAAGLAEQGQALPDNSGEHFAYDSGILVNPQGDVVLHHRKYQVLNNAFTLENCPEYFQQQGSCQYSVGNVSDIEAVDTPFGRTSLLVCADAYTYDLTALTAVKELEPDFVIVPWGVGASQQSECGQDGFNATQYAAKAAQFIGSAYVAGANAIGERPYGRFRPAIYCGNSGYANPDGSVGGVANSQDIIVYFDIPVKN